VTFLGTRSGEAAQLANHGLTRRRRG
jgi:hypothetical protein